MYMVLSYVSWTWWMNNLQLLNYNIIQVAYFIMIILDSAYSFKHIFTRFTRCYAIDLAMTVNWGKFTALQVYCPQFSLYGCIWVHSSSFLTSSSKICLSFHHNIVTKTLLYWMLFPYYQIYLLAKRLGILAVPSMLATLIIATWDFCIYNIWKKRFRFEVAKITVEDFLSIGY